MVARRGSAAGYSDSILNAQRSIWLAQAVLQPNMSKQAEHENALHSDDLLLLNDKT